MTMLNFFRRHRSATSADSAKERLQILLSHERVDRSGPEYLPMPRDIPGSHPALYAGRGRRRRYQARARRRILSTLEINVELPGARVLHTRGAP